MELGCTHLEIESSLRLRLQDGGSGYFNYLCTYDLYSPVHNVLDSCISIPRGIGRGLGPGILEFFGPCEMALSL